MRELTPTKRFIWSSACRILHARRLPASDGFLSYQGDVFSSFPKFMNSAPRKILIGSREITDESDAYVIAEIGHNHQGSLEKARDLFHAAKMAGVDAVKLQKRDNKALFTKAAYNKPYENENSYGATYGEHREFLEFGKKEYRELGLLAKELKMDFFSTAFDFPSADFLAELNPPAFKIASGDLKTIPLLKYIAKFGKPMILSTGGGDLNDIRRALDSILPINTQLSVLHCTATYPTEPEDMHLRVITTLRTEFPNIVIGLSDHYNGIVMAPVAYVLGARIFEKHFTLNHTWKGTDHAFSLEPVGMHKMVRDLQRTRIALGNPTKVMLDKEKAALGKMGKSLFAARALTAGHTVTLVDVAFKSPGGGIPPYDVEKLIGRTLKVDVAEDAVFAYEQLT
jgi:sialic acid synthase